MRLLVVGVVQVLVLLVRWLIGAEAVAAIGASRWRPCVPPVGGPDTLL